MLKRAHFYIALTYLKVQTNKETSYPIPSDDVFYQEKQSGGKCSIHALNAFAGKCLVSLPNMIKKNNEIQIQNTQALGLAGTGVSVLQVTQFLKDIGIYTRNETDIDNTGIAPNVVQSILDEDRRTFNIPNTARIIVLEARLSSFEITDELNMLQTEHYLHRMIIGVGAKHYIALRKDRAKKWRVVDSMRQSHRINTFNVNTSLQPKFDDLISAVHHAVKAHATDKKKYKDNNCILIYPSTEKSSLVQRKKTREGCKICY